MRSLRLPALLLLAAAAIASCKQPSPDGPAPAASAQAARATFEVAVLDDEVDLLDGAPEPWPRGVSIASEGVPAGVDPSGEVRLALVHYLRIVKGPDETIEQTRARATAWLESRGLRPDQRVLYSAVEEEDLETGKLGIVGWRSFVARKGSVLTGKDLADATADVAEGQAFVKITLLPDAAERFRVATRDNLQRRMAVVIDGKVASAPVIQSEIPGGAIQIGLGEATDPAAQKAEAQRLAAALRAAR